MYKGNTEIYLFQQFAFINMVGVMVILFCAHGELYDLFKIARILFLVSILCDLHIFFGVKLNEGALDTAAIINMTFRPPILRSFAVHVSQPSAEQEADVIKDFKKGFLPVITPVAIVCVLIRSGESLHRSADRRYQSDAVVYRRSAPNISY